MHRHALRTVAAVAALSLSTAACHDEAPSAPTSLRSGVASVANAREQSTATGDWSDYAREKSRALAINSLVAVRVNALLGVAQLDAVVRADDWSRGTRQASRRAAVAAASAAMLSRLLPRDTMEYRLRLEAQLADASWIEPGADVEAGLEAGRAAAAQALARAATDGWSTPWTGTIPTGPGLWQPENGNTAAPGGISIATARPFVMASPSQFRPDAPPAFGSEAFVAALAEVRQVADARTPEQDSIAKFWNGGIGASTPTAFWHREATRLAGAHRLTERATAHLMAVQGMAAFDALIACNDAKYVYWVLRPSQADPAIVKSFGNPHFPSFPSNHACISAAQSEVIAAYFPAERARMHALADEAALSRVFAGTHYRFDGEVGMDLGRKVARQVLMHDVSGHVPPPMM
jgi:membrane-associated phospholipid phosphatase